MSYSPREVGVRIALAADLAEAEGIQLYLGLHGIESTLEAVVARSDDDDSPIGIWVAESDAKRATNIIMWSPPRLALGAREAVQRSRRPERTKGSGPPSRVALILLAISIGMLVLVGVAIEVLG
jgi:hypothetical protein